MHLLITGGLGFVGSHITNRLLAEGHRVTVVDDRSSAAVHGIPGVSVVSTSLEELTGDDIPEVVDAVIHAAAYAELRHNWATDAERERLYTSNIVGTIALLEAMPAVPIVFLSSASVYGSRTAAFDCRGEDVSATESGAPPETCESPYAASKIAGEALIAAYAFKRGTPWHVLRLVNVVGARSHRGVIADFVRMMRETGAIHAADDGKQTKPWVHVADVVDAVVRVLHQGDTKHPPSPVPNGIYNVTSGELISWWDITDAMGLPRAGNGEGTIAWVDKDRGCVGDPHNLRVSGKKLAPYLCPQRSVREGIQEALASLGWTR